VNRCSISADPHPHRPREQRIEAPQLERPEADEHDGHHRPAAEHRQDEVAGRHAEHVAEQHVEEVDPLRLHDGDDGQPQGEGDREQHPHRRVRLEGRVLGDVGDARPGRDRHQQRAAEDPELSSHEVAEHDAEEDRMADRVPEQRLPAHDQQTGQDGRRGPDGERREQAGAHEPVLDDRLDQQLLEPAHVPSTVASPRWIPAP
jgi:hypothetical protein